MAKILLINGSYRKRNTYNLLKRVSDVLSDHDIEIVNISDYDIKPCIGCEKCLRKGMCHIQDDADKVLSKMIEADGIIIGTPIYLRHIPGSLKTIFDRGCSWYHRSPIVGKPMMFVTTTQVTGTNNAIKYLKDLTVQWGTIYSGAISRTLFTLDKKIDARKLRKFNKYIDCDNLVKYKPSLKQMIEFNTQKVLAKEVLPIDFEYWQEKGYIERPYFYRCKISNFKRLVGFIYFKFLSYIISKNKTDID